MSVFIVVILVNYVGMTYGPIGAFLAEFFPSRIRYTSVSVPYHIGNGWGGGLVPIVTTAAYAKAVENGSSDPLLGPGLSHRGSRDHVPDRHLRDAGNAQTQHLGGRRDRGAADSRLGETSQKQKWGQNSFRPLFCGL